MKFVDEAFIDIIAGDGGNGCVSFRHEKSLNSASLLPNCCNSRLSQELRVAIKCSEAAFSDFIAATETRALEYCG